jgi:hypothetical protein
MVGCCHDEKEYWTILKHIASDKEREVKWKRTLRLLGINQRNVYDV